ncbi:MAG: ABC transporter ATP-binding protein, partial [Gemmatimonadaceae bacterium]
PDGARALAGRALASPPGRVGPLGPRVAGTSSRMRAVAMLQAPDAGTLPGRALDAVREPERLRAPLGDLPQEFGL